MAEHVESPFTAFTIWQRRYIVFLAAFAGMFSPLSSFIFYPAINLIASDLNVSIDMVNLSITTYMVVSGVMPALLGNAADHLGRRPIYILALSLYLVANIGLALANNLPALLILRMIQSAGSSGTISLGYGVIADVIPPSERGFYVGVFSLGPNVAPPVGPVIGGTLAAQLGWKWIFWFLVISGAACLLLLFFTLPETARSIVGDGSIPAKGINRLPVLVKEQSETSAPVIVIDQKKKGGLNPIACLQLLLRKDNAIVLLCYGIYYMTYCCVQASLSTIMQPIYHLNELQAGLIYIPFGIACLASVLIWGKLLNYDYAKRSRQMGLPAHAQAHTSLPKFPLEKARLQSSLYLVVMTALATIGYGWSLEMRAHIAIPLSLQAVIGFSISALFVTLATINTDLNTDVASTAAASANIVRCSLAAVALAVLQMMIDNWGVGWCFTFFGLICAMCGPLFIVEIVKGPSWRQKRLSSMQAE